MRRASGLWDGIVSFENLVRAARRAALGKTRTAGAARFLDRLEPEALGLQRELEGGTYRPGPTAEFRIYDPKERRIAVSPFRDRVVHHALIDCLEPVFEKRMIADSYACRPGKGVHAAVDRAQEFLRRHEFFLALDIEHFFETVRHDVALETIGRILKDRKVLDLFETIVRSPRADSPGARGLPIGSLTSQWIANLVLDRLDHHVKETLRIPGYVRYMDDFVLFSNDKASLARARSSVDAYVRDVLGLALKERATILAPASQGLPFLGVRIYRGTRRVRPENARRNRARIVRREWECRKGRITERQLADSVRSVIAHLEHATTRSLRRRWFESARDPPE